MMSILLAKKLSLKWRNIAGLIEARVILSPNRF